MFMYHRAWRHAYAAGCWQRAHAEASAHNRTHRNHSMFSWSSGPTFGVRRPLRHLAWKLNLSEAQVRDVVDVLDRLKTAYNQARLDQDRSTSDVAAAFTEAEFDADRVTAALANRTRATEVLNADLLDGDAANLRAVERRAAARVCLSAAFRRVRSVKRRGKGGGHGRPRIRPVGSISASVRRGCRSNSRRRTNRSRRDRPLAGLRDVARTR